MKRKMQIVSGVLGALFMMLLITVANAPAQQKFKFKCASAWSSPETSFLGEVVKVWQDEVTQRTKGGIVFENYWGGSLGAPAELIELLKGGVCQVVHTHQWYTPSKMPLGDFEYTFPFGPTDYELLVKAMRAIRSEFPEFKKELEDNGAIMIIDPPMAVYDFQSKIPIKKLEDFRGEKICAIGRYLGKQLPNGSSAVVRPGQEFYDILRSGVARVAICPWNLTYTFKLQDVCKYYLEVGLVTVCGTPVLMNLKTFDSLPQEYQKIVVEAGKEIEMKAAREILPKWKNICYKAFKEAGMQFFTLPDEERKKWAEEVEDTVALWASDVEKLGLPGFKIAHRWQDITSNLGYRWPRKWAGYK